MPIAAPVAAALIMAAATVGTAIYQQQTRPGMPKIPKPDVPLPPAVPKELPEIANTQKENAEDENKRMVAAAVSRKRAAQRQAGGVFSSTANPLGTATRLGQ